MSRLGHRHLERVHCVPDKVVEFVIPAIARMLLRDERLGPFMLLVCEDTGEFVQWCGSSTRALRYEWLPHGDDNMSFEDPVTEPLDIHVRKAFTWLISQGATFRCGLRLTECDTFDTLQHAAESRVERAKDLS